MRLLKILLRLDISQIQCYYPMIGLAHSIVEFVKGEVTSDIFPPGQPHFYFTKFSKVMPASIIKQIRQATLNYLRCKGSAWASAIP
jgi:hypothetical protein